MGELTAETPKPFLRVAGKYLIEYTITNLKNAGINNIVINICWHGEQIKAALGDGKKYGVNIAYSEESERLETAAVFSKRCHCLATSISGCDSDIITDYPLQNLPHHLVGLAHLVMVPNPSFHPRGDFGVRDGLANMHAKPSLTFRNIGLYSPALFAGCQPGHFALNKLLFPAIENGVVTAEQYDGVWYNIGTPEQLELASKNYYLNLLSARVHVASLLVRATSVPEL